jgi:hypothetical protein
MSKEKSSGTDWRKVTIILLVVAGFVVLCACPGILVGLALTIGDRVIIPMGESAGQIEGPLIEEGLQPTAAEEYVAPPVAPQASEEPPGAEDAYQRVQRMAGEWSGEWRNITFASSGDATASVSVDAEGGATFTIDLDGMVFGMADPPPMTYSGTYDADGAYFEAPDDPLFGDLSIRFASNGDASVVGELVPVEGVARLEAYGTATADGVQLFYTVYFLGGSSAEGELTLHKLP